MTTNPTESALDAFRNAFGGEPTVLGQAPGRVELLGNHTDYNGGLVMAAAIDRSTVVVGRPVSVREVRVRSVGLDETDRFAMDRISANGAGHWSNYVRGVIATLQGVLGPAVSGFEAAIAGNVPLGAGLSSSASLQGALALFLRQAGIFRWPWPFDGLDGADPKASDLARMELAKVLRRSENEFVGVASGLLDQFTVLFGREGQALRLDCWSLAHEVLPLGNPAPALVVCDSKTSRRLADGMYNQRRAECERINDFFREKILHKGPFLLSWVTLDELRDSWDELDPVGRRRARHVLSENDRVRQGTEALKAGDTARFGRLMTASHASSRDDFENSSPALDALIAAAEESPGFLGGKLSGAGWAGCTVNLVESGKAESFATSLAEGYARRTGIEPTVHICRAAEGATGRLLDGSKKNRKLS